MMINFTLVRLAARRCGRAISRAALATWRLLRAGIADPYAPSGPNETTAGLSFGLLVHLHAEGAGH